jgi:prevent-host-death family protein
LEGPAERVEHQAEDLQGDDAERVSEWVRDWRRRTPSDYIGHINLTYEVTMKAAKVSELKAGLSKYLARVKRGEQVVITERGRPVAKLVPMPPRPHDVEPDEWDRILELERQGRITIPEKPGGIPDEFWTMPRPKDPEGLVLKQLLKDREEGW